MIAIRAYTMLFQGLGLAMYDVRDVRETGGCDRVGRHVTGSSMQFEDGIITRPLIISSRPGRALLPILGPGYS